MTLPPKPLKFLYSKYASHSNKDYTELSANLNGSSLSQKTKAESLVNLDLLGKEFSRLERVEMYFATTTTGDAGQWPVRTFSSAGSASTNGRSSHSRKDRNRTTPSRFRSRSQEFQNMYKLAASRSSPDQRRQHSLGSSRVTRLPQLGNNNNSNNNITSNSNGNVKVPQQEENLSADGNDYDNPRNILQVMIKDRSPAVTYTVKPAEITNFYPSEECHCLGDVSTKGTFTHHTATYPQARVPAGQLPRCPSRSTVDADRLDSSHYQYLLDDFTSMTSSTTLLSVKSDPASTQASARAQRPSTANTVATAQRIRELYTCTTEMTTPISAPPPGSSQHTTSFRSPDTPQWPPRHDVIPSWPSYEDIQTLNRCENHRNLMTRLYRRDSDFKFGRRTRDRALRVNIWGKEQQDARFLKEKVVVVPSHTSMECAMCNLYNQGHSTTTCPPNTPLVHQGRREAYDQQSLSQHSTSCSLLVNHSVVNRSQVKSQGSRRCTHSSHEYMRGGAAQPTLPTPLSLTHSKSTCGTDKGSGFFDSNNKKNPDSLLSLPSTKTPVCQNKSKGVSFTWDTCKLTYVKANG